MNFHFPTKPCKIRNAIKCVNGAILLFLLVSCAVTSDVKVSSSRSLQLTPELLAKKGSVVVLTKSKLNKLYPSEEEFRQAELIEDNLKQRGFMIVESLSDADYGFSYVYGISNRSDAGYSVIGDHISRDQLYVHQVLGELYARELDGEPGALLWSGSALIAAYHVNLEKSEERLFTKCYRPFRATNKSLTRRWTQQNGLAPILRVSSTFDKWNY